MNPPACLAAAARRHADETITLVANRRPARPSDPTAEDRLGSIEDRLDRIEAVAREVLDGLTARIDRKDA
jgi:hypothetical protein